jgi:hypothetical protein
MPITRARFALRPCWSHILKTLGPFSCDIFSFNLQFFSKPLRESNSWPQLDVCDKKQDAQTKPQSTAKMHAYLRMRNEGRASVSAVAHCC